MKKKITILCSMLALSSAIVCLCINFSKIKFMKDVDKVVTAIERCQAKAAVSSELKICFFTGDHTFFYGSSVTDSNVIELNNSVSNSSSFEAIAFNGEKYPSIDKSAHMIDSFSLESIDKKYGCVITVDADGKISKEYFKDLD